MTKTNTATAAQIAKVTARTIRRWITAGKVTAERNERGHWVVNVASLRAHCDRRNGLTTAPAHVIAHRINRAARVRAFVQPCGTLRIVTRTCANAKTEIGRAVRSLGLSEEATGIDRFQVRFTGTEDVLTYPMVFDPMQPGIDTRTGAVL